VTGHRNPELEIVDRGAVYPDLNNTIGAGGQVLAEISASESRAPGPHFRLQWSIVLGCLDGEDYFRRSSLQRCSRNGGPGGEAAGLTNRLCSLQFRHGRV